MKPWVVTVEGKTYDVDAPDERTAWQWANQTHAAKFKSRVESKMTPAFEMEARNPASSYSSPGEEFMPFMAGVGKGMTDIVRGVGQMAGLGPSEQEIDVIKARDKSLMQSGAGMAGNMVGGAAMAAPAALIPGANTVLGGALIGGGLGASQPVGTQDSRLANTGIGATIGGAVPAAIKGVTGLSKIGRNLVDPLLPGGANRAAGRAANEAAGTDKQAIVAALRGAPQGTTAGEAAAHVGRPEFNALQEVVKGRLPTAYDRLAQQQNASRIAALRSHGMDKAGLPAAEAQRSADAAKNYGTAYAQSVRADPALAQLAKNPYFKEALPEALNLANANNVNPKTDMTQFLHYVKIGLDKQLSRTGDLALDAAEKKAVQDVKKSLVQWMGQKNPAYDAARQEFAKASGPINQMEVSQYLENKLVPALGDQGMSGGQRASMYAQALREAPQTIKKATGQTISDDLSKIMTPAQEQALVGVGKDLGRSAEHQRLGKVGREMAKEFLDMGEVPPTGIFYPLISAARSWVNKAMGKAGDKSMDALAKAMLNPQEMARLMENATPQQTRMMADLLRASQIPITGGAVAPLGD